VRSGGQVPPAASPAKKSEKNEENCLTKTKSGAIFFITASKSGTVFDNYQGKEGRRKTEVFRSKRNEASGARKRPANERPAGRQGRDS